MDAQIDTLCTNNIPPSDEVAQSIKQMLLPQNIQDLQDIDSNIAVLERRLEMLRSQQAAKKQIISRLQSILAPIRRVPPEVLGEIFVHCLPTHRNPIIQPTECPLLLTHICHFWRASARVEPRLWAQIHITFALEDPPRYSRRGHATKILRRRLSNIKKWLSRSGTRSLSLSICFTTRSYRSYHKNIVFSELILFLAQHSPRFKHLELNMPLDVYRIFESMMDVSAMSKLASVRVEFPNNYKGYSTPIAILQAPNLRQVSISATYGNIPRDRRWRFMKSCYAPGWREVTNFSCHKEFGTAQGLLPMELIVLLTNMPNLIFFKAVMSAVENNAPDPTLDSEFASISLPFLQTFSIIDEFDPWNNSGNLGLYDRIDAPGLIWVEYTSDIWCPDDEESEDEVEIEIDIDGTIVSLLERLPALKKLTIDSKQQWGRSALRRIFQAVPSITHLVFGYEERTATGLILRDPPSNPIRFLASTYSRYTQILLYDLIESQVDLESNNDVPLLPNLVSLDILTGTWNISEIQLIEIIVGRMKLFTTPHKSRIALLKHVGVFFYRQRMIDVAAQIKKYVLRMGLDMIDLFLDYPAPEREISMSPHSPQYGLRALDGRSWDHKDAEEFCG